MNAPCTRTYVGALTKPIINGTKIETGIETTKKKKLEDEDKEVTKERHCLPAAQSNVIGNQGNESIDNIFPV